MKLHCISDTHTLHREIDLPGGDTLIHAGDIMSVGDDPGELIDFLLWFDEQRYAHKIFIAGNHDHLFEKDPELAGRLLRQFPNIKYLQDSSTTIDGITFFGSPWIPTDFPGKAFSFQRNENIIATQRWAHIPKDIDVLITHGPVYGKLDKILHPVRESQPTESLGDVSLGRRIEEVKPQVHICGHIHSGQGILNGEITTHINAASLGEDYRYSNKRRYIEWDITLKIT